MSRLRLAPYDSGAPPPRGSKTRDPQPWSTITTPARGLSLTVAASSIEPTDENTRTWSPSVMPSSAASFGLIATSLRFPDGCRPGSSLSHEFIECRLRRFASWNG